MWTSAASSAEEEVHTQSKQDSFDIFEEEGLPTQGEWKLINSFHVLFVLLGGEVLGRALHLVVDGRAWWWGSWNMSNIGKDAQLAC